MALLSFDDAIEASSAIGVRHVLLGNGFSISCRPDCFTYGNLLDEATFEGGSIDLRLIFDVLGTTDFERVIEALQTVSRVIESYGAVSPSLIAQLHADADVVRDALARALAARHPANPFEIPLEQYAAARRFLQHFERIYTINYDTLLYWAVMQEGEPRLVTNDGFGNPESDDAPYVAWQPYVTFDSQRLFYLHGGLHLYDSGAELAKITWSRTMIPLVDQIRSALDEGRYPLIVTEGTSEQKTTRILHSAYLNHAIRSFSSVTGSLFLYGLSLADNDQHLLRRIETNKRLKAVFVSIYGDVESAQNRTIVARANALRDSRPALAVDFFDAESASVWATDDTLE